MVDVVVFAAVVFAAVVNAVFDGKCAAARAVVVEFAASVVVDVHAEAAVFVSAFVAVLAVDVCQSLDQRVLHHREHFLQPLAREID